MGEAVLENTRLRLAFTATGRLTDFGALVKDGNEPVPPFSLMVNRAVPVPPDGEGTGDIVDLVERYIRSANEVEAEPLDGTIAIDGDTAVIRTTQLRTSEGDVLEISAELRVVLVPDTAEARWSITVDNRTADRIVHAVTLPRLHGLVLEALYCPFRGGECFPHAISDFADMAEDRLSEAERGQPRVLKRDGRYVYELPYAGRASMPWLTYVDAEAGQGVYLAAHDPSFPVVVLHADTEGASHGLNLELRTWTTIGPGQTWASADYVVAATDGDWHSAAARYRAWFDTQIPLTFAGGALRDTVAVYLPFLKTADGRVRYRYADLPAAFDRAAARGVDQLMPYGWMAGGFDTTYPEFFPDLELGGPVAMARAHQAVHERGGRIVTYLNARIFNRRSTYYEALGQDWSAKQADGTPWTERYGAESFAVMCPGVEGWRTLLADLAETMATAYGTDVVYYDQLAAMAVPCHDPAHGHDTTASRNQQYAELLRQAAAQCPDTAFSIEQATDLFAPHVLFQGTLGVWLAGTRFNFPELYKFTFPEVLGLSFVFYTQQPADAAMAPFPLLSRDEAAQWLCRDILTGAVFGVLDQNFEDHPWWDEAVAWLALRRAANPWIGHGVFRDDADVLAGPADMAVKTFRREDTTLVGVHNPGLSAGGLVAVRGGPGDVVRLHADGSTSAVPAKWDDGQVIFEAPAELLSMTIVPA